MRSIHCVTIATCIAFANPSTLQQVAQAATPTSDVVVEIKLVPQTQPVGPVVIPHQPRSSIAKDLFPSFNSEQLDRQLQRYIAYIEQNGVPDVLILGSSRALQGIDPLVLQQTLEQQGYPRLRVFNFGINGATAQVVNWLLHQMLPPDQLPRLLVWADGSRALNSGRIDHTFNKILASAGNRELMAGKHPFATSTPLKLGQVCMDLLPVPLSLQKIVSSQSNFQQLPAPKLRQSITSEQCQQPIKLVFRQSTFDSPVAPKSLESLGFQSVKSRFNPAQYFQRYARVPGNYDADYRNFALAGNQTTALANISKFANTRQIPLVFVNLPLTSTHLDGTRRFREDQFREQMQRLARTKGFTFIDLSRVDSLTRNSFFADPSHLNQFGASAVAQELAKEFRRLRLSFLLQQQSQAEEKSNLSLPNLSNTSLVLRIRSSNS